MSSWNMIVVLFCIGGSTALLYNIAGILQNILKAQYRNNELLSETKKELETLNRRMGK